MEATTEDITGTADALPTDELSIHNTVITDFSTWLLALCVFMLVVVGMVGLVANTLDLYATFYVLRKHRFKKTTLLSVFIMCLQLLPFYFLLIPMTVVGVVAPRVLNETFCYAHETLTYTVIMIGCSSPALSSLDKLDSVVNHGKRLFNCKRLTIAFLVLSTLAFGVNIVPLFIWVEEDGWFHEHGCHLWSSRVDTFVWYQIFAVATVLVLSCVIMIFSYSKIFLATRARVQAMEAHRSNINAGTTSHVSNITRRNTLSVPSTGHQRANRDKSHGSSQEKGTSSQSTQSKLAALHSKQQAHRKVAMMATALVFSYIVFWMPWLVLMSRAMLQSEHNDHEMDSETIAGGVDEEEEHGLPRNTQLRILALVFGYIPAATDPLVFALMSPHITTFLREKVDKKFRGSTNSVTLT